MLGAAHYCTAEWIKAFLIELRTTQCLSTQTPFPRSLQTMWPEIKYQQHSS